MHSMHTVAAFIHSVLEPTRRPFAARQTDRHGETFLPALSNPSATRIENRPPRAKIRTPNSIIRGAHHSPAGPALQPVRTPKSVPSCATRATFPPSPSSRRSHGPAETGNGPTTRTPSHPAPLNPPGCPTLNSA